MSNSQQPILQSKTVLVESTGMQHWLNLQLAEHAGIAMNIEYPMPTRFVWQLCRDILGHDKVPMQSTYKREVMLWRIERLLSSDAFTQQNFEAALIDYWQEESSTAAEYKRVNISRLIADTLEQYLMFRPEWLLAWEKGESVIADPEQNHVALKHEVWQRWIWLELAKEEPNHPVRLQLLALEKLDKKSHVLPSEVYFFAINTMAPQTLAFFNQIAKYTQIHFFHLNPCIDYWGDAVSDRTLAKQLQQGKIDAWVEQQAINPLLRNLGQQGKDLFNLLSQSSHYEISAFDTDYQQESAAPKLLQRIQQEILQGEAGQSEARQVESNADAEVIDEVTLCRPELDDSIIVRSCHSALREVQVLHDYLLQQFSADETLSPRDVLVMCPAIENYSPYIEAVFGKSIAELNNTEKQRIPCTIADRNPLDADPLVAAFMQLMSLPDSRFSVTEFLSFVHLPAVMQKYSIKTSELDLFAYWVKQSNIHWGLDAEHKSVILGVDKANDVFTWHWGMSRLLEGFSHADNDLLIDDRLLALNEIEGQLAVTFGKLLHLLEKLASYGDSLKRLRTMEEWKAFLFDMKDSLFDASTVEQYASQTITKTLGQFFEHYQMSLFDKLAPNVAADASNDAEVQRQWSYQTLRQALQNAFTSPDSQNQFMTGQVTFCSMMPMRSIPFKVIAVLGLNDGEFPRQSTFVDMDLVNHLGRHIGDRSRRGDDRYLFLEALLSARKALYLSYQGRGIRDNKSREASLVLSEFLAYLKKHHQFDNLVQQPLHPFSIAGFSPEQNNSPDVPKQVQQNFDKGWYRLMTSLHSSKDDSLFTSQESQNNQEKTVASQSQESRLSEKVALPDLVKFFKKPVEFFANHSQGLWLDDIQTGLSDTEPFIENGLDVYLMKSDFIDCMLECQKFGFSEEQKQEAMNSMKTRLMLSGKFPDYPNSEELIDENALQSQKLTDELSQFISDDQLSGQLAISSSLIDFHFDLSITGGAVDYSLTGNATRHLIATWIKHLIVCAHGNSATSEKTQPEQVESEQVESEQVESEQEENELVPATESAVSSVAVCIVKNTQSKTVSIKIEQFSVIEQQQALAYLSTLLDIFTRGLERPLLIAPDLADKLMSGIQADPDFEPFSASADDYFHHPEIANRWSTFFDATNFPSPFVVDKYFTHYFPQYIEKDKETISDLLAIYQPLKKHMLTKITVKSGAKSGAKTARKGRV
ncbi:exodeoxyribonuclease V subunit gamma [Brumicola nitratireducens]|nr:exodeoxyribonuclease V subunit gamma [Glaciecola nitratireducens]